MADYNQICPDPGCDDSGAWTFVGFGASVSDSFIKFANPIIASSATVPLLVPVIGNTYEYSINIERAPSSSIKSRIHFGGVDIYNKDGSGTHTGSIDAVSDSGLIMLMQFAGQLYIDWIQIFDLSIPEPEDESDIFYRPCKGVHKHHIKNDYRRRR